MTSTSSGITVTRRTSTPSGRSSRHRKVAFASITSPRGSVADEQDAGCLRHRGRFYDEAAAVFSSTSVIHYACSWPADVTDRAIRVGSGTLGGWSSSSVPPRGSAPPWAAMRARRPQHLRRPPSPQGHPAERRSGIVADIQASAASPILQRQRPRTRSAAPTWCRRCTASWMSVASWDPAGAAALPRLRDTEAVRRDPMKDAVSQRQLDHDRRRHGAQPRVLTQDGSGADSWSRWAHLRHDVVGGTRVLPTTARSPRPKRTLESHVRQLASELRRAASPPTPSARGGTRRRSKDSRSRPDPRDGAPPESE